MDDPTCALVEALDDPLLKALADPTRCSLVQTLVRLGRADVASIAACHEQDRSVISRHLQVLHEAGVVCATKEGRHRFYALDGPTLVARLEHIVAQAKAVVSTCCP